MGLEISQLELLIKDLPFKIIEIASNENEETFHIANFKVVKDPSILIHNLKEYSCICKYMKARTKYSEAFADRLNSIIHMLKNAKKILKEIFEIQKTIISYSPIFSMKVMNRIYRIFMNIFFIFSQWRIF